MATINPEVIADRIQRFGKCYTIDDVIRLRGSDEQQVPILGVPRHKDDPADYEFFTGADLDRMVDAVSWALEKRGLPVNGNKTIAIYSASDLSFVVTFFALFRLGYKVLTVSIRLGAPACLFLLEKAECDTILHGSSALTNATLAEVAAERPSLNILPILARWDFDQPDAPRPLPFVRSIEDRDTEHIQVAMMAHSSGSTGLPKPLLLSHRSMMSSLVSGTGLKAFNSLPWYHVHGLIASLQAMWMRRPAHLFNPFLPLTAANLVAALKTTQPEIFHSVPYALSLIAEDPAGVEVLARCRYVTSAGAKTPDELGSRLIAAGVNLGVLFGLTEVGHAGDSLNRDPEDRESWAYVRFYANVVDHIMFKHVEGDLYETVYLKSHPALLMSNNDDPPDSYCSKDLFSPHPTIPNAWKYIARQDDRITLITGEKFLPLVMKGTVREHPLVQDVLMFGDDRPIPGMLIFRGKAAAAMTEDDFIRAVWPSVEQANAIADEFARLTPETVASIAYGVEYPVTDKSNIIRAGAYRLFASQIRSIYARLESNSRTSGTNGATVQANKTEGPLDVPGLEAFILDTFRTQTGIKLPSVETDFFAAGVDSLRAIQARRLFQELLDFGEYTLPTNVIYDARNSANLARMFFKLLAPSTNSHAGDASSVTESTTDAITAMQGFLAKYSSFTAAPRHSRGESVVLTGATGALGAHILHQLLRDPKVGHVTCLVRGPHGLKRILASLRERGLDFGNLPAAPQRLIVQETASFGDVHLGLDAADYAALAANTTLIIHAAWPVHFGLSTSSFEPHLAGLRNLLQLSLQVPSPRPARLLFASSISAAFNMPLPSHGGPAVVPETQLESLKYAASIGYARSKLLGEHICEEAARQGASVAVLRVGQITGDTEHGIWNDREAIPLMVNSALELKALPLLDGAKSRCEWVPVDVVAASFLEIAAAMKATPDGANGANGTKSINGAESSSSKTKARYYNINSVDALSWNSDVLPAFRAAGLNFEAVSLAEWLKRLRSHGDLLGADAAKRLPALKLVDYYAQSCADACSPGIRFDVTKACQDSPTLAKCPNITEAQLATKYLKVWTQAGSAILASFSSCRK